MSSDDGITAVIAPEPADMQRDVEMQTATPLLAPRQHERKPGPCDSMAVYLRGHFHSMAGYVCRHLGDLRYHLLDDLSNDCSHEETYIRCLCSCVFFLFCHAFGELFLEICCVCRCLACCCGEATPEHLQPQNRTEKFFAFFAKILSKLWVTTMVFLFIQWVLFRPIDVKPHLGTSAIHAFDLDLADAMAATPASAAPHLRFNLTAYLLFKNAHNYYNINYDNVAVSILYAGEKLGPVDDQLASFKQDPHVSTVMRLVLVGQLRNASSTVADMFSSDRHKGLFQMVVRIRVTLAYKSWPFDADYFTIYDCPLSSSFPQTDEPTFSSPAWCKTNDDI